MAMYFRLGILIIALDHLAFSGVSSVDSADSASFPRFKWGQTRDRLFVTIAVRSLDRSSVTLDFGDDGLKFFAMDASGKEFVLDLELVQDISPDASRWEHLQRPDRWGDAVFASLLKRFPGRWDTLVVDSRPYRKVMDRDWTREDQQLELPEEDTFFKDHRKYARLLTAATLEKERKGVQALVVNIRHQECRKCKVVDETFAKVAKNFSDRNNDLPWRKAVRFAIVDPRSERVLSRTLGGFCAETPIDCRYYVLTAGSDVPIRIKGRHDETTLLADLERLSREQFAYVNAEEARLGRATANRALIVLGPGVSVENRNIVDSLQLHSDVRLSKETEFPEIPIDGGAIWSPGEVNPDFFDGSKSSLKFWLQARIVAPLANTSTFEEDEPYEELGLPIARLFLNGTGADFAARAAVHRLARSFIGRIAFIARNATSKSHEWRHHGLPPERFPSFALAESMKHNATRYAFLDMPAVPQGNGSSSATTASDIAFWEGPAVERISSFLDEFLSGWLEPSYPSESPVAEKGQWGTVQKLVGRECRAVVESSETESLIEAFDEWRRDHANRTLHLDVVAPLLARWNITTYRLDLGYNECPPSVLPIIPAGYSGYFFVPQNAKLRKISRPDRLKKLDPSFNAVFKYIGKHSASNFSSFIAEVRQELEAVVAEQRQKESNQKFWENFSIGSYFNYAIAVCVGWLGIIAFFKYFQRKDAPAQMVEGETQREEPENKNKTADGDGTVS